MDALTQLIGQVQDPKTLLPILVVLAIREGFVFAARLIMASQRRAAALTPSKVDDAIVAAQTVAMEAAIKELNAKK